MVKFRRRLLLLLLPIVTVGLVAHEITQSMRYDQMATLLSSAKLSRGMEYVTMPHPYFEFFSYRLSTRIMSVKLSDGAAERYVLVPESEMSNVLERLERLNVPVVAID